jgi:hypothetical protein
METLLVRSHVHKWTGYRTVLGPKATSTLNRNPGTHNTKTMHGSPAESVIDLVMYPPG